MAPSVPASAFASVTPNVVSSGGSGLLMNAVFLTKNQRVPIGSVLSFSSPTDVSSYFGPSSNEYTQSGVYFNGFLNSNIKPGALLFSQYNLVAVSAWLRGGNISGMTLTALQALQGTLIVTVDGYVHTSSTINLTTANSFSTAATLIQTALTATEPTEATCTEGTIAGNVLTVAGTITGIFQVGQTVTGTTVTAGSVIASLGTGTGGVGTYNLSESSTVATGELITAAATAPVVTYDSVSGAFIVTSGIAGAVSTIGYASGTLAASLSLTQATGAVLSQGAAPATPSAAMNAVVAQTTNWVTFTTLFDPDQGSGNAQKLAFAAWNNSQGNRYAYAAWDTDITPTESTEATTSLGYLLGQSNSSGTIPIFEQTNESYAAFVCGAIASIDFTETNGRTDLCYKGQTGLVPSVTNETVMNNLVANGYNMYLTAATANQTFIFFYKGLISGPFKYIDSYINMIWLTNALQLAMITLLTSVKSTPYANPGYALIRASCMDPITAAVNFGAIVAGVPLSALEAAEVNNAAGLAIDGILSTRGWYLQILPATAQVRGNRASPPMTLWYMDGGSVQTLNLASVEVQ